MWNIEHYESASGKRPVEEFINSLDIKSRAKTARTLDLLEEFGIDLGMPYARHLEKQLWELRIRYSTSRHRIIYFLDTGKTFVLLHGFTKKTGPVPKGDMFVAESRREDYLRRRI